jgi:hypothetical protein
MGSQTANYFAKIYKGLLVVHILNCRRDVDRIVV